MNEFYVYALIDPRNDQIFYIGKGSKKRHLQHVKEYSKTSSSKNDVIESIISSKLEVKYKFIAENLNEEAAYLLEEILVERFGRIIIKTGNLTNLEPGGKWQYPKIILEENEKAKLEEVEINFPELIPIINLYPNISKPYINPIPWFKKKILKENAVYQYSINGEFCATHDLHSMNFITELSSYYIHKAIKENQGYIYSSQWSLNRVERMRDLCTIDPIEFEKLKRFDSPFFVKKSVSNEENTNYINRNQEVE